jgi:hypothetical protein
VYVRVRVRARACVCGQIRYLIIVILYYNEKSNENGTLMPQCTKVKKLFISSQIIREIYDVYDFIFSP